MRVKINDTWHEVGEDCSIMIELTKRDKSNIRNMDMADKRYAVFHPSDTRTVSEKEAWMNEDSDRD